MPKVGSEITTKDGRGVVESNDLIRKLVTAKVTLKNGDIERRVYNLSEIGVKSHQNANEIDDSEEEEKQ